MNNGQIAKVRANYTCEECGSTEYVQAHHIVPQRDDSPLVCLCAKCHSEKHPDVPIGLFFNEKQQPTCPNISTNSLSGKLDCHNRIVIRHARKLRIPFGEPISDENLALLRSTIGKSLTAWEHNKNVGGMHLIKISFTDETFQALKRFIIAKYGLKQAMSVTVQEAVREYLKRETKEK